MKIILTESELTDTMRKHYPIPAGYVIGSVDFKKYSAGDFCTVELERAPEPVAAAPLAIVGTSEAA